MKKKIFSVGTHNGIPFDIEKIKTIIKNSANKVKGIFDHTSVYKKDKEIAPEIAEFSNVRLEGNDVFADLEFNGDGKTYEKNRSIKGISIEISKLTNSIAAVALLPRRVEQEVSGALLNAEFEKQEIIYSEILEFEEIKKEGGKLGLEEMKKALTEMSLEDRLAMVITVGKSITAEEKNAFRAIQYEFAKQTDLTVEEFAKETGIEIEVKEAKVAETEAEIEARIEAKYAKEAKDKEDLAEFEAVLVKKLLPAHHEAYRMAYESTQGKDDLIEFEKGKEKVTESAHLKEKVNAMGDINLTVDFSANGKSKNISDKQNRMDIINNAAEQTKKMQGGK